MVTGHYDSLNLGAPRTPPASTETSTATGPAANDNPLSATPEYDAATSKNAALPAPGACDDGSGTAAVMELARVMSQYEFDKTLVFVAFAGEEQGLVGCTLRPPRRIRRTWPSRPYSITTLSAPTPAATGASATRR